MSVVLLNDAWAGRVRFANGGAAQTSATITKPSQATLGRLVVLTFAINSGGTTQTLTPPSGFTAIANNGASNGTYNVHTLVCYRMMDGTEGSSFTVTFNSTTNETLLLVSVYDGVGGVGAVTAVNTNNSVSPIATTLTTTANNSYVVFDAWTKGGTITAVNTGYPSGTVGVVANATNNGSSSGLLYAEAYQGYSTSGTVTGSKTFTSLTTTARYWDTIAYELTAGVVKTVDSVNGGSPITIGQTSTTINTTGLGTLTSVTIGGVAASDVSAPSGDGTFTVPSFVDGAVYPAYGSASIVASDGVNTASTNLTLNNKASQSYTTLTDVSISSVGYLKYYYPTLAIGDVVTFDTATTLGVFSNGVDVDGRLFTDLIGDQTMWVRSVSTGVMTQLMVSISNGGGGGSTISFTISTTRSISSNTSHSITTLH